MHPDDPRTDAELVEAAGRGDAAAFEALYRRHRDRVARLARRFAGNEADALDILQDAFVHLAGRLAGFRLTGRLTTYLYPVVKHLAQGLARRRRRTASDAEALEALPARPDPPDGSALAELHAVVGGLPEAQREALLMRVVDEMTLAEIAEALGVPVGTVKSRLHHAVAALREDPRVRAYFDR